MAKSDHKGTVQLSFQCEVFRSSNVICILSLPLVLGDVEVCAGGIVAECGLSRGEIFLALFLSLVRADEVEVLCD